MRRAFLPPSPPEALDQFLVLQREGSGLRFMLPYLPEGATLEDARCLYQRLQQESRTPCTILDGPLGIRRV
jgi:hypothetical protein